LNQSPEWIHYRKGNEADTSTVQKAAVTILMEKDRKTEAASFPGTMPMVRIDGAKIKQLREQKKLTQLYLSTVVGVTTDTISRWENRHYQSIKLENAEKLAQALEVAFEEILKQEEEEITDEQEDTNQEPPVSPVPHEHLPRAKHPRLPIILIVLLVVVLAGIVFYSILPDKKEFSFSAERILPPHAPPGQVFPVLIRVHSQNNTPVSLIIKESFPPGAQAIDVVPPTTNIDLKEHSLKWIRRTDSGESVYAYMCRIPADAPLGENLSFNGTVTLKQDVGKEYRIQGAHSLTVAPFHWADTNRDNVIDDEEILSVYDIYSDINNLPFDRDLIDSLWASSSYTWDPVSKTYTPIDD